jgi:signal transduction histidine kinase
VLARADATPIEREPIALSDVVDDRVDAWAPVAAEQQVRLDVDRPADVWVQCGPGAIDQILDNLLSNALDAAPSGSAVTIRVVPGNATTELHVIDEGPGMPAPARARAFERFWRPPRDREGTVEEGFGLGLAIVAQLASQAGGSAHLDDGPDGIGLDAVVTLPAAAAPSSGTRDDARADRNLYPTLTSR